MSLKNIKEQLQLLQQAHSSPGTPKPKLVFNPASENMPLVTLAHPAQMNSPPSLTGSVTMTKIPISSQNVAKSMSQPQPLKVSNNASVASMNETEKLIRSQQEKIEELQRSLKMSQAQLLLQKQQLQEQTQPTQLVPNFQNQGIDPSARKPIVLPNGGTLFSIKSEELEDSTGLPCSENNVEHSVLTQQAEQNQQLQKQLDQLQAMQQQIVNHQTQLMNTINGVNKSNLQTQQNQQLPVLQNPVTRQISEEKFVPPKIGLDHLKYTVMR